MGLLSLIKDEPIFIDSAPFIYFVERKPGYNDLLRPVFNAIDAWQLQAYTTTITCSEALVIPCRQGNRGLIAKYEMLLSETPTLTIVPFDFKLAKKAAEVRAKYGLKTPDAIQWATAVQCGARFFLTNDKVFKRFSDLQVLMIDDFLS